LFSINSKAFSITFLVLRIALGGLFLEAGMRKLLSGQFSASSMLSHATGPFAVPFINIASNSDALSVINGLVIIGEISIGIMLITGLLVRLASGLGILMMLLYYLPVLPPANGWIAQNIIYIVVLIVFMVSGIGYFIGLDRFLFGFQEKRHWLRYFLG
jgi:thiosulfate dehydrogenase [quinone] large subunit